MLPTLTVSRRTSSLMRLAASDVVSCGNTLLTVRASLSSRRPANFECRRWSTCASQCTPSWREPPNRGPKDCFVSTRQTNRTTFKRCMQIPQKSKAQFGFLSHREVL